jgi:DNA modification methylase
MGERNMKIIKGNCIDKVKELEDNSIDCVVSSPPYFGLRDYGVEGQFGLEPTYQEYIANTVRLFAEMRPKLKDSATIWWNVGDSYSSGKRTTTTLQTLRKPKTNEIAKHGGKQKHLEGLVVRPPIQENIKEKDLMMIPNRVAIALQDAGWYIRSEIIWHKPNPMPESVKDRPTSAHEKIWLITKNKDYYYNADVIREPLKTNMTTSGNKTNGKYLTDENEKKHRQGMSKSRGQNLVTARPKLPNQKDFVDFLRRTTTLNHLVENTNIKKTTMEHWFRNDVNGFAFPSIEDWDQIKDLVNDWSKEFHDLDYQLSYTETHLDEIKNNPKGKNKRNVWTVTTKPFKGAHFATFPEDLIKPCILAGCPEGGVVLDPFAGAGTTGIVAKANNRQAVLIELNPEYINIAEKRELDVFGALNLT